MRPLPFLIPRAAGRRHRLAATIFGALLAATILAPAASAAPTVQVVATGLDNPRGITLSPGGAIYVAEAGRGGDALCVPGPEGEICLGPSGAITRIFHRGGFERVATGLPSGAAPDGTFALGPHDVAFDRGGRLFATIGLGTDPAVREGLPEFAKIFGHVVLVQRAGGTWRAVADLAGFEAANNPDGNVPDSNPYSLLATGGALTATDAGGNDLLRIRADGSIRTLAVFRDRTVATPAGPATFQAVPTTVVRRGDHYYVGQLTGFPFPVGAARVWRMPVGGGRPEVYRRGFTNIIDIAFGPDGSLWVLEIAHNSLVSGDVTGALIRVWPNGRKEVVLTEPLFAPGGLAVRSDGTIYVTNCSICPGGGQVLRIRA